MRPGTGMDSVRVYIHSSYWLIPFKKKKSYQKKVTHFQSLGSTFRSAFIYTFQKTVCMKLQASSNKHRVNKSINDTVRNSSWGTDVSQRNNSVLSSKRELVYPQDIIIFSQLRMWCLVTGTQGKISTGQEVRLNTKNTEPKYTKFFHKYCFFYWHL